jgi:hypothetical protein
MNELIAQTGAILGQATELLKIPAISGAVTGLFGWLGKVLTGQKAKERLALIEQNQHSEETIGNLNMLTVILNNLNEFWKSKGPNSPNHAIPFLCSSSDS